MALRWVRKFVILFLLFVLSVNTKADPKFPIDFDDTDFYLTSRKGGPPSAVIEDIRRGQEGVLVKLRQVTNELENDELKLNNIFYKLGHHDTELKSVSTGMGRLTATGRKTETKLNKHAFNVEFLHRQVKELQSKLTDQSEQKVKMMSLQKTVDHLEDRLSETLYRLTSVENSSHSQSQHRARSSLGKNSKAGLEFIAQPAPLFHYPMRDEGACRRDWQLFEGLCFFVSTDRKSFKGAVASCAAKGAQLLSLTEAKRDVFLRKVISSGERYWTCGTDIFSPSQWGFLMSGDSIPRTMWSKSFSGYVSAHRNNNRCAVITENGLESIKCGHRVSYICEKL